MTAVLGVGYQTLAGSSGSHGHHHGRTGLGEARPGEVHVVAPGKPGPVPSKETGGRAVAFRPSGRPVSAAARRLAPDTQLYNVGANALEPTLGVDPKGNIFYIGIDGAQWPLFPTETVRSTDDGRSWDNVTPPPPQDHVTSEDPYLHVDETTGRVFSVDFLLPCSAVSYSDDAGETWNTNVGACDLIDHQTVFTAEPVTSETEGYPNVVYYCAIDAPGVSLGLATSCVKSLDGGQTFLRTGAPAFVANPNADEGPNSLPGNCATGASGHGVGGSDGTIYIPRAWCTQPWLGISRDEGLTWERVQVADNGIGNSGGRLDHDAAVAVDTKGNLYYSWTAADLKPYLAVSTDGGETWSKPLMIAPPGVKIATLVALDVTTPGNLAVSFIGSENDDEFGEGHYNGYMMLTTEALESDPLFYAASVNNPNDPLDGSCSTGSCRVNREFIDVAIAPDGTVWAAFTDGCFDDSCEHTGSFPLAVGRGLAGRLVGGPRLR